MYFEIINYLKNKGVGNPEIGLVLGSGLGDLADEIENAVEIPYENIPNFPVSTVEGHEGKIIYGQLSGRNIITLKGRFHYYEGYDLADITYPIRVFYELGIKHIILTNAAGGVNENFKAGDLMIINDHINLSGQNPLVGLNINDHGPRFVDLSETYSKNGQDIIKDICNKMDIQIQEGVYTWFTGPSYETPAEIRMVRTLGGDAVGMSTVPEAIVAKHCGIEVVGISCITNLAAGMQQSLSHDEVVTVSQKVKPQFKHIIKELVKRI